MFALIVKADLAADDDMISGNYTNTDHPVFNKVFHQLSFRRTKDNRSVKITGN